MVPQPDRSIEEGAIAPWGGRAKSRYHHRVLEAVSEAEGIDTTAPWKTLTAEQKNVLLHGAGERSFRVSYTNRFNRTRRYQTTYEGVIPWLNRRFTDTDSEAARGGYEQFFREVPCDACGGGRLNPVSLAVTIGGKSIHEVSSLALRRAGDFVHELKLTEREAAIAALVTKEIDSRLQFLVDVGLDYLTLSRSAATLAGGEAQRIRLATQIGSGLVGVLYILDEPSIGLHQRDNQRLIETLLRLRDLGNTLIVVEHDEETMRVADHIVDIGPGAGEFGGSIVAEGSLEAIMAEEASMTGDYMAGRRKIPVPEIRRQGIGRGHQDRRRRREQPQEHRRRLPAWSLRGRHRSIGQRQVVTGAADSLESSPPRTPCGAHLCRANTVG